MTGASLKIAIALPSRGLMHSRTVESLFIALSHVDVPVSLYFSHDNKIPDCFNVPLYKALERLDITHLMIIEEDMFVPPDVFIKFLDAIETSDIAYYDYPVTQKYPVTQQHGGYTLSGTGLIMFRRKVAEQLLPFRVDTEYTLNPWGAQPIPKDRPVYGKHDIDFFVRAQDAGFKLRLVGKTKHFKVRELGKSGVNDGIHKIYELGTWQYRKHTPYCKRKLIT